MFLMIKISSSIFILMFIKYHENPRWLFFFYKQEKAEDILTAIRGPEEAKKELEGMSSAALKHKTRQLSIFDSTIRLPLLIGITLAILQQFCGINAIIYYGPRIFESAGIASGN